MTSSRLLLVEATAGVGKSTLINALLTRYSQDLVLKKRRATLLHLTQAHTYAPLAPDEDKGCVTKQANLNLLNAIYSQLDWLVRSVAGDKVIRFFGAIETLHLTHCVRPAVLSWQDVQAYDQTLAALGCKLVYLKASPESIWQRTIESRQHTGFITQYSRKYGSTLEEIFHYYLHEQGRIEELVGTSALQKIVVPVDGAVESYLDEVYAFWEQ